MNIIEKLPNIAAEDFIIDYLQSCGVEDIQEFIKPTGKWVEPCEHYIDKNTYEQWCNYFNELVYNLHDKDKIYIVCDCDCDGICSATISYKYLRHIGISEENIVVLFHTLKQHGLSKDIMTQIKDDCILLWIPDAGSNDMVQCQEITSRTGCQILITDHHQYENHSLKNVTIISNQLPYIQNKALSGSGVTFKFVSAMCKYKNDIWYNTQVDLVMLGNLADVMDMSSMENRCFNYFGLRAITNEFLIELCNEFCPKNITPKDIVWGISPKINAVFRSDNQQLKKDMFWAFVGENKDYANIISQMKTQHNKQKNESNKIYKQIIEQECEEDNKVLIKFCDETSYTGLVANKLMEYYNKPIFLVHNDGQLCFGSCRSQFPIREQLIDSGCVQFAQGHDTVFGLAFDSDKIQDLTQWIEKLDLPSEPKIDVVHSFDANLIPQKLYYISKDFNELWGHGVEEPLYHIHNITINSKDIQLLGANKTTIKFNYKGVDYIKFFANDNIKSDFKVGEDKKITIEIVGKLQINEWRGSESKQVLIEKYEVTDKAIIKLEDLW